MRQRDDADRLSHMLEAATKISKFTTGKTRRSLDDDEILYHALTWLLQVIGEAARHVAVDFKALHPEFEWENITNFRHRIVHGYDMIDKDIMWTIVEQDVPDLIINLRAVVK